MLKKMNGKKASNVPNVVIINDYPLRNNIKITEIIRGVGGVPLKLPRNSSNLSPLDILFTDLK